MNLKQIDGVWFRIKEGSVEHFAVIFIIIHTIIIL